MESMMQSDTDLANQIIDEWIAGQTVPPTVESILADWEYQASERDPRDPMRDRIYMEAQVIRNRIAALEGERYELTAALRQVGNTVMAAVLTDTAVGELQARIAALQAELASGSFYKESDIDALMADRDETKELRRALEIMLHAVCGETGFASAVRKYSGFAYPWPALDEAERIARAALGAA